MESKKSPFEVLLVAPENGGDQSGDDHVHQRPKSELSRRYGFFPTGAPSHCIAIQPAGASQKINSLSLNLQWLSMVATIVSNV